MTHPLPARLSPRAWAGTRRFLRGVRRSPLARDVRAAANSAFWPAVFGSAVIVGLLLVVITRGQYVSWDGVQSLPVGGAR